MEVNVDTRLTFMFEPVLCLTITRWYTLLLFCSVLSSSDVCKSIDSSEGTSRFSTILRGETESEGPSISFSFVPPLIAAKDTSNHHSRLCETLRLDVARGFPTAPRVVLAHRRPERSFMCTYILIHTY